VNAKLDPDIITGYNTSNFDFWYIITRAEHLGAKQALYMTRLKHERVKIKNETFTSRAYGRRESRNAGK
jgi:DNA polymerase delta subunit 1